MEEKVCEYKRGDFVIVKIKGYPALPARLKGVNGKEYYLHLYGTDPTEIAILTADVLFDCTDKEAITENMSQGLKQFHNDFTNNAALDDGPLQLGTSNYVILKTIMNQLNWLDLLRCELVCRSWRRVVKDLQREKLRSYDFVIHLQEHIYDHCSCVTLSAKLDVSHLPVQTRPMFVICFYNASKEEHIKCKNFSPALCDPPCDSKHDMIEGAHEIILSKRSCLLAVHGPGMIYKPLPNSRTFHHEMTNDPYQTYIFLVGLYLPEIALVSQRKVQYRGKRTVQEDVYSVVDDICHTDIIKGVIVFVLEEFMMIDDENWEFLKYFKSKQPSIPYALGGFVTMELASKGAASEDGVLVEMRVFSVPKEPEPEPQFHMHSLIIGSALRERTAIENVIQTFAENVCELQFSAALTLSCYERETLHAVEQELFRASFPRTSALGCYGDGEDSRLGYSRQIGYSHPDIRPLPTKRAKTSGDHEPEFLHSESTVFVYFSWGKQPASGE